MQTVIPSPPNSERAIFSHHRVHLGGYHAFARHQIRLRQLFVSSAEAREPPMQDRWRLNHSLSGLRTQSPRPQLQRLKALAHSDFFHAPPPRKLCPATLRTVTNQEPSTKNSPRRLCHAANYTAHRVLCTAYSTVSPLSETRLKIRVNPWPVFSQFHRFRKAMDSRLRRNDKVGRQRVRTSKRCAAREIPVNDYTMLSQWLQ